MKKLSCIFYILHLSFSLPAQVTDTGSTKTLDSVIIRSFEQYTTPRKIAYQVCALPSTIFSFSTKTSLLNGLNTVAGVRMEERSPGSYRINIRGSSLRSPFGVRNIKVYWNGFPVTDPGGNTYFNQFASNNFNTIEIVKGPVASLYGAGTGGLVMLENEPRVYRPAVSLEVNGGSYGLRNLFLTAKSVDRDNNHFFSYAHNATDGYRVQSSLRRDNFSWLSVFKGNRYTLKAALLFTDMYYGTPGGLTKAEYAKDPAAARPAAGGLPAATTARAAIYQQNLLTGISNKLRFSARFTNTTLLYATYARVKNPAIRNYEKRSEPSFGGRTVFSYNRGFNDGKIVVDAGAEWQKGYFNTTVSRNKNGSPDSLLTDDDINNSAAVYFLQVNLSLSNKGFCSAGAGMGQTKLRFSRMNSYPVTEQVRRYRNEFSPQLAIKRSFGENFQWSVSAARGFSPPTVAEVLPSTGVISTYLEAEKGWNVETGLSFFSRRNKTPAINIELSGFYFRLQDALVQRRDASGADYFINAGKINQRGLELHMDLSHRFYGSVIRELNIRNDITVNHFRYGSFIRGTENFSGKVVPSVPASSLSFQGDIGSRFGLYVKLSYYGNAPVYLNDANTAKADPYHLLGTQLGWKNKGRRTINLHVYAGIDNLLNETYSLGNDINAAGGRYYNAAPKRNYYAGVYLLWTKPRK